MTSATFAISAGWTCTGPIESQRAAPPPECPKPTTHSEEQQPDDREQRVGQLVEAVVVDAAGDPRRRASAADGVGGLALQEELRVVVLHRRLHGARAVDHHDAEADERDDDRGEHRIDRAATRSRVGLGVEGRGELHADGAADVLEDHRRGLLREGRTARTNSSPRCL